MYLQIKINYFSTFINILYHFLKQQQTIMYLPDQTISLQSIYKNQNKQNKIIQIQNNRTNMIKQKSSDLSSIPAIEITKDAAGEQYVSDSEYQDGSRRNSRSQQMQQQQAQVRLLSRPGVYI